MISWDVPVVPDAEEARRWAEEELSRSIYHERTSWWEELIRRIFDLFIRPFSIEQPDMSAWSGLLIMALLLVTVIGIIVFASRLRRNQKSRTAQRESAQLFTDNADSSVLYQRSERARLAGNYTEAFLQYFRAVIRSADERALIHDRPGLTAQEAAHLVGQLPQSDPIAGFANIFDAASYGDQDVSATQFQALRDWAVGAISHWKKLAPLVDVGEQG